MMIYVVEIIRIKISIFWFKYDVEKSERNRLYWFKNSLSRTMDNRCACYIGV